MESFLQCGSGGFCCRLISSSTGTNAGRPRRSRPSLRQARARTAGRGHCSGQAAQLEDDGGVLIARHAVEHRVGVRAELQRLGVAVAALIAREVREAAVGRRDELLGIGAEGPGAAEVRASCVSRSFQRSSYSGAAVPLSRQSTQSISPMGMRRSDSPRARGCPESPSLSEVTHSGLPTAARRFQPRGEGGYLRREPRQLLPRRDGLRGQLRACRRGRHRARCPSARRAATDPDPPPSACTMAVSIETVQRSPRSQGCSPRRDVRARSAAALRVARGVQVQKVHARAGHLCRSGRAPMAAVWRTVSGTINSSASRWNTSRMARMTPALQVTPPVKTTGLWTGRLRTIVAL